MTAQELSRQLEAILFVAAEPLQPKRLAGVLELPVEDITTALDLLRTSLSERGLSVTEHDGAWQLVTHPHTSQLVNRYLGSQSRADLTKPALETLAIIAWKQPVTKTEIEELRGVSSDQTLRGLLARDLITEAGKSTEAGHQVSYKTTARFLHIFGLTSPGDLPALEDQASPGVPDAA